MPTIAGHISSSNGPFFLGKPQFLSSKNDPPVPAQIPSEDFMGAYKGYDDRASLDFVMRFVNYVASMRGMLPGKFYTVPGTSEFSLWKNQVKVYDASIAGVTDPPPFLPLQHTAPFDFIIAWCTPLAGPMQRAWDKYFSKLDMSPNAALRHRVAWQILADLTVVELANVSIASGARMQTAKAMRITSMQNVATLDSCRRRIAELDVEAAY